MNYRIITPHMTQRTAERGLSHMWAVQVKAEQGDPEAQAILARHSINSTTRLLVRHERRRFYKWAVVTPA